MSTSPADSELDAWQSGDAARRYFVVDVFTEVPLEGNQLAVFTDARGLSSEQMQRLAREMNFSETVFVLPPERNGDVRVRIFTPRRELPFAGHPVLGCAFVVAEAHDRPMLSAWRRGSVSFRSPWRANTAGPSSGGCSRSFRSGDRTSARSSFSRRSASSGRGFRSRRTRTGRGTCMWSWRVRRRLPR